MYNTILIVEDEFKMRKLIKDYFKKEKYIIIEAGDGPTAIKEFKNNPNIDIIILDIMIPELDGYTVCEEIREISNVPIIMLTAKGEEVDKILGLEIGADDYVTKPFSTRELVARVKAVLRRAKEEKKQEVLKIGEKIEFFPKEYKVKVSGKEIELTSTEFRILLLLAKRKGWVFSRDQILDYLYEGDRIVFDRTVDVHVAHLREKLGKSGEYIKSIRGIGYKIEE